MITPPVDSLRDVLRLVKGGVFDADPDAVVQELHPRRVAALTWPIQRGLIDEGRIALTEMGHRYFKIIGGA